MRISQMLAGGIFLASLIGTTARAADVTQPPVPVPASDEWIITIGGTAKLGPSYEGADSFRGGFIPRFSWRRAGTPLEFSAPDDGIDYTLFQRGPFSFGPVLAFRSGRYYADDRDLFGLRKIPWTVEAGAFAQYWLIPEMLRTRVEVRQGFHGHHGVVADFSVDGVQRYGRFRFSAGPRLTLASNAFMDKNFGITGAEAAANGRVTAFNPSGGIKSAGLMLTAGYDWNESWTTLLFTRYDRLVSDAGRSGIVSQLGSRNQFSFGATMTYSFRTSF